MKAHYLRTDEAIKISYSGWMYRYSITIYKNGTFDYKTSASYRVVEAKKDLKNPLINKYNYNSIKDFVENGNHSGRKILDYIYLLIADFSKIDAI